MFLAMIICFVVLVILALVVYGMPSQANQPTSKKKEKKEKSDRVSLMPDPVKTEDGKDWKAIAERWERQNLGLQGDLEKGKMEHKQLLSEIDHQKEHIKELMDKLAQEKNWREKGQENLDKAKGLEKDIQNQLMRAEKDLEKEHSSRLAAERELQDIRIKYDAVVEEKRTFSTKSMSLDTTVNALTKQVSQLTAENKELKKKREDIQWVAKSEFDQLKKTLQATEAELARLKQSNG